MINTAGMAIIKSLGNRRIKNFGQFVGKVARMEAEGMTFEVVLTEHSRAYGHHLFRVAPKRGEGSKVVRADRLTLA